MRVIVILMLIGGVIPLDAGERQDHKTQLAKLMLEAGVVPFKAIEQKRDDGRVVYTAQVQKQVVNQYIEQQQVKVTKKKYGSMKKPYKTITIDVYQETDVSIEQKQKQIALLIQQLKQLQETKVKVDPKIKVVVR